MATVAYVEYAPTQLKLPVKFTAKAGKFMCVFGNIQYEDVSLDPLKARVLKAIETAYAIEWTPVIALLFRNHGGYTDDDSRESASLYLVRERKYIGYHADTGYKQVRWDLEPEKRLKASFAFHWEGTFSLPTQRETSEGLATYLPYTDATWTDLKEIHQYLSIAHAQITKHLKSSEDIHTLLEHCRGLFDHAVTAPDTDE